MVTCLDEPPGDVLKLLAGLNEQIVSRRNFDRDSITGVPRPDVQSWIPRTTMDGEEVEIGVETGKDGVDFVVLSQVRSSWSKKMGPISR